MPYKTCNVSFYCILYKALLPILPALSLVFVMSPDPGPRRTSRQCPLCSEGPGYRPERFRATLSPYGGRIVPVPKQTAGVELMMTTSQRGKPSCTWIASSTARIPVRERAPNWLLSRDLSAAMI